MAAGLAELSQQPQQACQLFFLQWNDGDFPFETYFVFLPDSAQFDPKLFVGHQIRDFEIQFEGLAR